MTDQNKEVQKAKILRHLEQRGTITSAEAFHELGVMRLASRIHELKAAGFPITDSWAYKLDSKGKIEKKWKVYRYV